MLNWEGGLKVGSKMIVKIKKSFELLIKEFIEDWVLTKKKNSAE